MTIESIAERAAELDAELAELAARDELDEEAEARFEEIDAELGELAEKRAKAEKRVAAEERARKLAEKPENRGVANVNVAKVIDGDRNPYDGDVRMAAPGELRGRALDAVERDRGMDDASKEHVSRLIERSGGRGEMARRVLLTGRDDYRYGFSKLITGNEMAMTDDERRAVSEVRAASLTTTAGGFAVPFTLDPSIILTNDGVVNPMRQIARTITIDTDQWNGVSSAGVTASWDGEAGEVSDDAPTLAQPSIDVEKAQAFVPASIEITQDWAGMAEELAMLFADAKDRLEGAAFVTGAGSGSNAPTGVVTAVAAVTSSRVAAVTNNSFGLVDVYATLEGLAPRHRPNASFMANLNIINDMRQFGTANNYHGFLTDLAGDTPRQLLGKPLYESSSMDGAIATGDDDILIVGDFSKYYIVDRVGLEVEYIPHLFATGNNRPSGQRGWYAYWRTGGGVVDTNAFRSLRV